MGRRKDYLKALCDAACAVGQARFKAMLICDDSGYRTLNEIDNAIDQMIIDECEKQLEWNKTRED